MKGYDRRFGRSDEESISIDDPQLKNMVIGLLVLALALALL
ncbi:MAG: hypothetical protein R6U32_04100 [Candidatus Woesearchaeota archaeon]